MEMFEYARNEIISASNDWVLNFFDKAGITRPVMGDYVRIEYYSWGDYFTSLSINGNLKWSGKLSTP
jgi:hypothetical protein